MLLLYCYLSVKLEKSDHGAQPPREAPQRRPPATGHVSSSITWPFDWPQCHFLTVLHYNRVSISNRLLDIGPQHMFTNQQTRRIAIYPGAGKNALCCGYLSLYIINLLIVDPTHNLGGKLDIVATFSDYRVDSLAVDPPGVISDHSLITCRLSAHHQVVISSYLRLPACTVLG